jgi:hypothetical protein
MIPVRVGNDRPFDRAPRIDVEIAGRTIQAFRRGDD